MKRGFMEVTLVLCVLKMFYSFYNVVYIVINLVSR